MVKVIAWDPTGIRAEGGIVPAEHAPSLEAEGVALLPFEPELRLRNGAGGYARRGWGAGWDLSRVPGPFCPLVLHCVPGRRYLAWKMRIRPIEGKPRPVEGFVRLAPDATQWGATTMGFGGSSVVHNVRALGELDRWGGWTVLGVEEVNVPGPQYLAVSGYGFGEGLTVEWIAATQT